MISTTSKGQFYEFVMTKSNLRVIEEWTVVAVLPEDKYPLTNTVRHKKQLKRTIILHS